MIESQDPQGISPSSYLPAGPPEPQIFEKFDGIDTQTSRPGVKDEQAWWMDGFMPIGPRFLRTMYDIGDSIYTVPTGKEIVFIEFANVGRTPCVVVILNDGRIDVINTSTGALIDTLPNTYILNPSRATLGVSQYGSQYIIIVSQQSNGYFLFDLSGFYVPGGGSPSGGTMPTAIGGSAVEVYQGRVWIASGPTITFSAPGSAEDFSTGSGGGSFQSSDSFLRSVFTQLKQTNGFLYLIGDSSINYISGVQTSGTPPVTTFTNQNADPEVGTPWSSAMTVFNRNIILANAFGVHVSYGAAVTKISDALDGIYGSVGDFGSFIPSVAKAIIFAKKVFIILLPIIDPYTGQQVNKLLMWDGKRWWASEQGVPLIYIQYQEIDSLLTAWGTDGTDIYPLFQNPSTDFTKVVQSKLWDKPGDIRLVKGSSRLWGMFRYYSDESPELRISIDNETGGDEQEFDLAPLTLDWFNNIGAEITWYNSTPAAITWRSAQEGIVVLDPTAIAQNGVLTGLTVATEAADMAIIQLMLTNEIAQTRG